MEEHARRSGDELSSVTGADRQLITDIMAFVAELEQNAH